MTGRQLTTLTLRRGETQRILIEARCAILVISGDLLVRGPQAWLADSIFVPERSAEAEQCLLLPDGGWVDMVARENSEIVLIPRWQLGFWRRAGRCIERLLACRAAAGG